MDLNPDRITPSPGNPGVGMSSKVLVHPSHICQIGAADQGHFASFSLRHGWARAWAPGALTESLDGFLDTSESVVSFAL